MTPIRRFRTALAFFVAGLVSLGGCAGRAETFVPPADPMVGQPAPPFVFHSVHHRSFPSSNFAGKTLVMAFIRPGQPDLQTLLSELLKIRRDPACAGADFVVLSPENDPLTEPFWLGLRNPLPIVLDFTGAAGRYGAGALPLVVVRDFKGIVRLRLDGFVGADLLPRLAAVRKMVETAERERASPSRP